MRVLSWEELRSGRWEGAPIAAAIGVFDGLHVGHRALIEKVLQRKPLASAVVTFRENPKRILAPSSFHGELSTLDQRLELIESMGIDLCVLIDFSGDFSKLPGRQFLSMLSEGGELRFLAVGSDFRCGHALDTDAEAIRSFCAERSIEVEFLQAVHWAGHPVSSSRIRRAVIDGRLEDAAGMLGRAYEIDLRRARTTSSGLLAPVGGQASPPPGAYEASISYDLRAAAGEGRASLDETAVATLTDGNGSEGGWKILREAKGSDGEAVRGVSPASLRLFKMVSRE